MATPKSAVVRRSEAVGQHARRLDLELEEPLGFAGGQYIIVDSGRVLPSGKAAKRAYSLLSRDSEQQHVELVVKRIPSGLCSDYVHGLAPGEQVKFSGPWGKFSAAHALALAGEPAEGALHLVLASDTGITAALGLVGSQRFQPLLASTLLLWLRPGPDDFVSDDFVRSRLPEQLAELRIEPFLPVHHPERLARARALVLDALGDRPLRHAFPCGDGILNYGLMPDFAARGAELGRDQVESFFNLPKKQSA